jgi:NADPH:quinone reductase-like Zn-dependent oxidoreductase
MKAIIQNRYGDENTLQLVEVDALKVTKPNEILVDVHFVNITAGDKNINTLSQPLLVQIMIRLIFGWNKPKAKVRGICGSGVIKEVGSEVNDFKVGDHVNFINSMKAGALTEQILLNTKSIISKVNPSLPLEVAACIPFGPMSAYHFINEKTIQPKDQVYIYGVSGAVGSAALSLATHFGANIIAVASNKHHEKIREIANPSLIDYQTQNPFDLEERFDLIFDGVGKISKKQIKTLLKPDGKFSSIKSPTKEDRNRLSHLNTLANESNLKIIIDQIYDFEQYKQAHKHVYDGHKSGNVLIKVRSN